MKARPTCEEVQLLASEVALGIASGDERALVLAHTRSCSDCRRMVEELSATADALVLLGPVREPSSGFESDVLAKMRSAQRPSVNRRSRFVAVAAASVLITAAAGFWVTSDDRRVAEHYRDALAVADGEYFGVVPLQLANGDPAGHLFAYEGDPAWVFFIFDAPVEAGSYEAQIETEAGEITSLGTADLDADDVTWGRDIPVELREVRSVRMIDDQGDVAVEATFGSK